MEKNRNGYPTTEQRSGNGGSTDNGSVLGQRNMNGTGAGINGGFRGGCAAENSGNGRDTDVRRGTMNNNVGGVRYRTGCMNNGDVSGDADGECDEVKLGYVYAPNQKFCMLFSAEEALKHGTLFENLYKPMEVYGRE